MNLNLTPRQAEALHDLLAFGRVDVDNVLKTIENQLRAEIESNRHTTSCRNARSAQRRQRQAYCSAWPGYCRKCGGEGGHTDYEYRGECHGVQASEQVYEYCPHCIGQGICPRCGSTDNNFSEAECDDIDGNGMKCNLCDWQEGDPGAPEVDADCGCFEDAAENPYLLTGDELERTGDRRRAGMAW